TTTLTSYHFFSILPPPPHPPPFPYPPLSRSPSPNPEARLDHRPQQQVAEPADAGRGRNRRDPRPDDSSRHAPPHRREALHRADRSEEHTSELQSRGHLVCRLLLEKKKKNEFS